MDYKFVEDLTILSRDSIINEYNILHGCYNELKVSDQRQCQVIHQLKRELQTALNDKQHLSSELEIINSEHGKTIEQIQERHRDELQKYKDRLLTCQTDLEVVESARDNLEAMLEDLKKEGAEEKQIVPTNTVDGNQSCYAEKVTELECENDELAEVVQMLKDELTEALKLNLQNENKIEDLSDRLRCTEENLKTKRDELEERNEMYETAQERVIQLSGELNAIRTESDTAAKRGNSLFAEVDDQRQKMKSLLVAQKANYIEMKNDLERSHQEIRKLKRENTAMYKEMEVCSHMFLNAEQHHTEKLNERIAELMKENEAINKKLTFTEECLSEMITKNDVKWLDPMISLCKNESNDLKDKLYRCSLQKVTIAGTLRQCEEESARWRFEALKSRCIIADREALLEDNKIPFSIISDIDRRIRKIDNDNVSPIIACRPSMLGFKRRSLPRTQSPQTNAVVVPVNDVSDKILENPAPPKIASQTVQSMDVHEQEFKFKKPFEDDSKPVESVAGAEVVAQRVPASDVIEPIKTEKLLAPPSTERSGVTIRKKMISSAVTSSTPKIRSTGTHLPTPTRPKINSLTTTAGILKPSSSPNVPIEKKVKFNDGGASSAKKILPKPSSARKVEKVDVDGAPKTAIKKRIFIAARKPTK